MYLYQNKSFIHQNKNLAIPKGTVSKFHRDFLEIVNVLFSIHNSSIWWWIPLFLANLDIQHKLLPNVPQQEWEGYTESTGQGWTRYTIWADSLCDSDCASKSDGQSLASYLYLLVSQLGFKNVFRMVETWTLGTITIWNNFTVSQRSL